MNRNTAKKWYKRTLKSRELSYKIFKEAEAKIYDYLNEHPGDKRKTAQIAKSEGILSELEMKVYLDWQP